MNSRRSLHPVVAFVLAFALILSPLTPILHAQEGTNVWLPLINTGITQPSVATSDVLFRTQITVTEPTRWARLHDLGVTILERHESSATVLVDYEQLADLARLRFHPRNSEEFGALVTAGAEEKPWLARSLRSLGEQAQSVRSEVGSPLDAMSAQPRSTSAALMTLRAAAQSLTMEQRSALSSLPSLDDDGDGLTNTEEGWWCTDPLNPNSDSDAQGYTDGQEVAALLDVTQPRTVRWGYGPPFGPPNAWPNFNNRDGSGLNVCNDGDFDTIPDFAEAYMVGTRVPYETTDNDKFDDGQELFGITYCPGAPTNCGYGSYPAIEYWNFIKASMPNWVLPPGDSPFVAAFPVPEVYVVPSSWVVERVTTITTTEGEIVQKTDTVETSVTRGQSTSIANTVTWNEWEEVSQAVETPLPQLRSLAAIACEALCIGLIGAGATIVMGGISAFPAFRSAAAAERQVEIAEKQLYLMENDTTGKDTVQELQNIGKYTSQLADGVKTIDETLVIGFETTGHHLASIDSTLQTGLTNVSSSLDGVQYAINRQGALLSRGLHNVAYAISQPRLTETKTSGKSWGGAQTTTHEVYEEHTASKMATRAWISTSSPPGVWRASRTCSPATSRLVTMPRATSTRCGRPNSAASMPPPGMSTSCRTFRGGMST
jgi:hypothetical protein